tara:strand:+ start:1288 stop:1401 length:114 start_codon:yes stop_codon:yes gene_type:complete
MSGQEEDESHAKKSEHVEPAIELDLPNSNQADQVGWN